VTTTKETKMGKATDGESNRRWSALIASLIERSPTMTDAEVMAELVAESGETADALARLDYVRDIRRLARKAVR
jgi:hypothetical protein